MKKIKLSTLLFKMGACDDAVKWAKQYGSSKKEWKRAYDECPYGSWLAFIYEDLNIETKLYPIIKINCLGYEYEIWHKPGTWHKNANIVRSKIPFSVLFEMAKTFGDQNESNFPRF